MTRLVPLLRGNLLRSSAGILFRNFLVPLRDFVYPPVCLTCESMLEPNEEKVCTRCWTSIPRIDPTHPVWIEFREKSRNEGAVSDFLSCFLFEKEGKLREIIHLLKYGGMRSLGERLGRELGAEMSKIPDFLSRDALIPVPLNNLKQRERGYNQAESICGGISAVTNIPVLRSLIIRERYTQSQTELDRERRRENVAGAFRLNAKYRASVRGRSFILVDDIITTGSTVNACASALMAHGAERVLAVSAALASSTPPD